MTYTAGAWTIPRTGGVTPSVVSVASPGAGNPIQWTVPAGQAAILQSIGGDLSTSAVVANRVPYLHVFSGPYNAAGGPNSIGRYAVISAQGPSELWSYMWAPGLTAAEPIPAAGHAECGIPPLVLLPGWTLAFDCINFDPGDNWTAMQVVVG